MKKIIALVFVVVICLSCVIAVSADSAINESEQKILDTLSETISIGDAEYVIPASYINQAKNYFMTVDVSAEDAEKIISYIEDGQAALEGEDVTGDSFDLSDASSSTKSELLELAQEACAVINLSLTYDSAEHDVTITENGSTTPVFEDTAVIKSTGLNVDVTAIVVVSAVLVMLAAGAVVVSKKVRNF